MFGRGLASLAAIAAILVVGSSAASGQEGPVLDPESVGPLIPYSVGEQLAARGRDLDDMKKRHPWVINGAPFPLNFHYVGGTRRNSDGSGTPVYCLIDVAAEHPLWYQENLLRTWAVGGVRCNVRLDEAAGGSMTGTVRALSYPSGAQLAEASFGPQHQVPQGSGSGWQAYGIAEFDRANMNSSQHVRTEVRLVLPAGSWSTRPGCTRGPSAREITCELTSPPFQTLPYPCPGPLIGGKIGAQPGVCADQPKGCDINNGQYGIQPNCVTVPCQATPPDCDPQAEVERLCSEPDAAVQWVCANRDTEPEPIVDDAADESDEPDDPEAVVNDNPVNPTDPADGPPTGYVPSPGTTGLAFLDSQPLGSLSQARIPIPCGMNLIAARVGRKLASARGKITCPIKVTFELVHFKWYNFGYNTAFKVEFKKGGTKDLKIVRHSSTKKGNPGQRWVEFCAFVSAPGVAGAYLCEHSRGTGVFPMFV